LYGRQKPQLSGEASLARTYRETWGQDPFALDPAKPAWRQRAVAAGQLGYLFGGPLLGLATIGDFPPLVSDQAIYITGLASVALLFAASFVVIRNAALPRGLPLGANLMFRAGWALCTTFLLLGVGGIVNGYGAPLATRDAPAVAKRETLQRDPARRTCYVAVRAWPGQRRTVDLSTSHAVCEGLDVPIEAIDTPEAVEAAMPDAAVVRLTVGEGRLGLPWLKSVDLAGGPSAAD